MQVSSNVWGEDLLRNGKENKVDRLFFNLIFDFYPSLSIVPHSVPWIDPALTHARPDPGSTLYKILTDFPYANSY
jgi:hypothetical protein